MFKILSHYQPYLGLYRFPFPIGTNHSHKNRNISFLDPYASEELNTKFGHKEKAAIIEARNTFFM